MGTKAVDGTSKTDIVKWLAVVMLIIAGVAANRYFSDQAFTLRLTGWIVLACVAGFIALQTQKGRKVLDFARQAKMELRKVVWSSRQEVIRTTMVVIAIILVMALLLWGVDSLLLKGVSWLTNLS